MNLRKRLPASDNDKVMNLPLNMHLKHWPENVRRKRTALLRLNLLDSNIPGWCIKKSAWGWAELAKLLDDNDRKMLFSLAAKDSDSTSELQGFLKSSGARCKAITEGSCKIKRVWCPNVGTLPNDSIIKAVNCPESIRMKCSSVKKYSKQLRTGVSSCLNEDLIKFVNCPESIRKKRSSSSQSRCSVRPSKRQKGARQKIPTFSTYSLPEEVIEEILSRLPVKSLARFRCVCKSWEHLFNNKRFISLHLNNYRATQLLAGTCRAMSSKCSMYFLPPPPPKGGYCDKDRTSQEIRKQEFPHLFGGSCNGIVCLYGRYAKNDVVLWNPATNESRMIEHLNGYGYENACGVGLGYDPMTNDYKILKMVYGKLKPPVAQLELYSLSKDLWKTVDCHEFLVACYETPVDITCSLPFTNNRIVCFVVAPVNGTSKWEIIKFDMSRETYEVIPVPPSLDAELGDYITHEIGVTDSNRYFKLFPLKESIAIGIVHGVGKGSYCDIWVLNDFSSTSTHQQRSTCCWSKILTTDMNDGYKVPVGCWGRSQIIFQETCSARLFQLDKSDEDNNNNKMMELGVVSRVCVSAAPYKESLVKITDY